jgi:serine/threonine protein kinase
VLLAPDTELGPFEVVRLLGVGGMGEVYAARDRQLNRSVALKVLRADLPEPTAMRGSSGKPSPPRH